jgi:hypothetical protein
MPLYTNPAEYLLELVNTDFAADQVTAQKELETIIGSWGKSEMTKETIREIEEATSSKTTLDDEDMASANKFLIPFTLTHRSIIKSYRDMIAYGIRIAMYIGLAIMMGTVWLRLGEDQENIRSFLNAIVSCYRCCLYGFIANRTVLWRSFYVLHGCRVHSCLPRRSLLIQERARRRTVWTCCIHGFQLHHRPPVSL